MSTPKEFVRVVRGPMEELRIYDVTELELETLEHGGEESIFLNFALSLGSIAASLAFSIFTTKIDSERLYNSFMTITLVFGIASLVLGALWMREKKHSKTKKRQVIETIRKRIPALGEKIAPENQPATAPSPPVSQ